MAGRVLMRIQGQCPYHRSRLHLPWRQQQQRQFALDFLPLTALKLNPIERVWKLARRLATHNRYFATLPEVLKAVTACFDRWRRPNEVLRRLCCIP